MDGRFTVIPQVQLAKVQPLIAAQLRGLATLLAEERFGELFDASMRSLFVDGVHSAGADEGTVWLLDATREFLVPRFNSGPHAAGFVEKFRQPLSSGMISMVVATEQPICENEVQRNRRQDRTLDQQLQVQTCAMLAAPFYFVGELRGVISCVQLQPAGAAANARGFSPENLRSLQLTGGVLSRLIEHRLLALGLGLEGLG